MRRTTQGRQKIVWLFCRKRRLFRHKHYSGVAIYITKDTIALNRLRKGDSGSDSPRRNYVAMGSTHR